MTKKKSALVVVCHHFGWHHLNGDERNDLLSRLSRMAGRPSVECGDLVTVKTGIHRYGYDATLMVAVTPEGDNGAKNQASENLQEVGDFESKIVLLHKNPWEDEDAVALKNMDFLVLTMSGGSFKWWNEDGLGGVDNIAQAVGKFLGSFGSDEGLDAKQTTAEGLIEAVLAAVAPAACLARAAAAAGVTTAIVAGTLAAPADAPTPPGEGHMQGKSEEQNSSEEVLIEAAGVLVDGFRDLAEALGKVDDGTLKEFRGAVEDQFGDLGEMPDGWKWLQEMLCRPGGNPKDGGTGSA